MPGSEFRILPTLPLEYEKYRTILPNKLGSYMTKGWQLVAAVNYNAVLGDGTVGEVTRFLMGKDLKAGQRVGGPLPMLSYPQPEPSGDAKDVVEKFEDEGVEEEVEEDEGGEEEEVEEDEDDDDLGDVKADMDELLGDGGQGA